MTLSKIGFLPLALLVALAAPPARAKTPKPMDLQWTHTDANGFPKNPSWGIEPKLKPGEFADPVKLCRLDKIHAWSAYAVNDDPAQLKGCTNDKVYLDIVRWVASGPACWGVFPGHADWLTAVTFDGRAFQDGVPMWGGGLDNDFSFDFEPLDAEGKPSTHLFTKSLGACDDPNDPACKKLRPRGLHLETWDSESIAIFELPFWKKYRDEVSAHAHSAKVIDGHHAIATGMVGLDCAHECHVELHPLFALAIKDKADATSEHWGMFARNYGNGGYCSSTNFVWKFPHDSKGRAFYKFQLPWRKGAKSFTTEISGVLHADSDAAAKVAGAKVHGSPDKGVVIQIFLPKPEDHGVAEAEVTVHWVMEPGHKHAPPPPPPPAEPRGQTAAKRLEQDSIHEALLESLTPAQRKQLPAFVEPRRAQKSSPMVIEKLAAPPPEDSAHVALAEQATVVHDAAKEQRMKAHFEALRKVLGSDAAYKTAVEAAARKLQLPASHLQDLSKTH